MIGRGARTGGWVGLALTMPMRAARSEPAWCNGARRSEVLVADWRSATARRRRVEAGGGGPRARSAGHNIPGWLVAPAICGADTCSQSAVPGAPRRCCFYCSSPPPPPPAHLAPSSRPAPGHPPDSMPSWPRASASRTGPNGLPHRELAPSRARSWGRAGTGTGTGSGCPASSSRSRPSPGTRARAARVHRTATASRRGWAGARACVRDIWRRLARTGPMEWMDPSLARRPYLARLRRVVHVHPSLYGRVGFVQIIEACCQAARLRRHTLDELDNRRAGSESLASHAAHL